MSYSLSTNVPSNSVTAGSVSALGIDKAQLIPWRTNPGDYSFGNVNSPLGLPLTTTLKYRRFDNIYSGRNASRNANTVVPLVSQLPRKNGIELHLHVEESWTIEDSADVSAPSFIAPASASLTLRFPENQLVTSDNVLGLVQYLLGILQNVNGNALLAELMRGSLDLR